MKRKLTDRQSAGAKGTITPTTRISDLADVWLEERARDVAEGRLRPQSLDTYRRASNGTVKPGLGGLRLREVTTGKGHTFFQALSPGSAADARKVLVGMLDLLRGWMRSP